MKTDLLDTYIAAYSTPPILGSKASEVYDFKHAMSHMICGATVGTLLQILIRMKQPKYVLELGTMLGYSTICLATYLPEKAVLHTIEVRAAEYEKAKENVSLAGLRDKVISHNGDILKVFQSKTLPNMWDFIFMDSDKKKYVEYYEYLLPKLNIGGIIVADNALFRGQVLEENPQGINACAIHNFNVHIRKDPRVENVLLNVRDGIQLIIKIKN